MLSVWGVVLGVASVTAMLSATEGARREALRHVEQLGVRNLLIRQPVGDAPGRPALPIRDRDVRVLRAVVPGLSNVVPVLERYQHLHGTEERRAVLTIGTTPLYPALMGLRVVRGRYWSPVQERLRVCVLGSRLAIDLFPGQDALGRVVRSGTGGFVVVGLLAADPPDHDSAITVPVVDHDDAMLVPIDTTPSSIEPGDTPLTQILASVRPGQDVTRTRAVVERVLAASRPSARPLEVIAPVELLRARQRTLRTFDVIIAAIALLSLTVSGIGIFNVMLASVVERTAEIGLRRAAGARRILITTQFLAEGIVMTTAGGVAGAALGAAASLAVTWYAGWPMHVSSWAVGVSLGLAVVTGAVASTYPALRAARLQPIDAVRYE
jgi:putative ABC transport system permease protein